MLTCELCWLDFGFDSKRKKKKDQKTWWRHVVILISLPLVARWCVCFGYFWLFGGGGSGWRNQLNPPCHAVLLCQGRYQASFFHPAHSASHPLVTVSALIWTEDLCFSFKIHSSYLSFSNFASPSPDHPPPPANPSLPPRDGAYQRQNKQPHCVLRELSEHRQEMYSLDGITIHRGRQALQGLLIQMENMGESETVPQRQERCELVQNVLNSMLQELCKNENRRERRPQRSNRSYNSRWKLMLWC